ncbi:hypothetical protein FLK61_35245 [Paenalkalicoccus suaedae]|uniref:Uncharacterized protein n=1 Tax=Paenalkalicoccus suaedae TaxID=2592382 RepID=A0A859FIA1_9BACI|nr:hypothetical protein [Paenalkalicoccus suaedae]QKS71926.1 hypothetical protein FLK61_35245 [Paenalkalicoccus suaedae]
MYYFLIGLLLISFLGIVGQTDTMDKKSMSHIVITCIIALVVLTIF